MTVAALLLKAPHIGVRELKTNLSRFIKENSPFIVTDRGKPIEVLMPYSEMVEIAEIIDEATDLETLQAVKEGREAIKSKVKGISVSRIFNKIRKERKWNMRLNFLLSL